MDVEDFGDSERPNIPAVFALKLGSIFLCTYAEHFIAIEATAGTDFKVLYTGKTLTGTRICSVNANENEFVLCTVSRVVERRRLRTGELIGKIMTATRLSGLALCDDDHILSGNKFGDVTLQKWSDFEKETIKVIQDGLQHLRVHHRDVLYANQYKPILDLWPDITEDSALAKKRSRPNSQVTTEPLASLLLRDPEMEEMPTSATAEDSRSSVAGDTPTRNKFDSGKDPTVMFEEFEEAMGSSLMGHMATITTLSFLKIGGKGMCVTSDKDEKIRVTQVPELWDIDAILTGHTEFITDVAETGNPTQILSTQTQIGESLLLPKMPIKLIRSRSTDSCFTILCAASTFVYDLAVTEGSMQLLREREFGPRPALAISSGEEIYIDDSGRILNVTSGAEITHFPHEAKALFVRYWKHDREADALSIGERRAKRLRHDPVDES